MAFGIFVHIIGTLLFPKSRLSNESLNLAVIVKDVAIVGYNSVAAISRIHYRPIIEPEPRLKLMIIDLRQ